MPQCGSPMGHSPRGCPCASVGNLWYTVLFYLDWHRAVVSHWRDLQGPCYSNPVTSAHCTTHSPFIRNSISSPPEESAWVQADRSNLCCSRYEFPQMIPFLLLPQNHPKPDLTVYPSTPKTSGTVDEFGIIFGTVKSRSC